MGTMMRMAREIETIANNGLVSARAIEDQSADLGVPAEDLYAGLAMSPQTTLSLEHALQFVVCLGGCQERGALPCVNKLLEIQKKRHSAGTPSFDIVPRQCLNRCQNAPVVEIRSSDGNGVLTAATPKMVAKAIKELLD